MYHQTLLQFQNVLRQLHQMLGKAQAHADARKFDSGNYLTARLAPDMFPLVRQIQTSCDVAKYTAARLSGRDVPRHEDNEKTLAELQERVQKTLTVLSEFTPAEFAESATRHVVLPRMAAGQYMLGQDYLLRFAMPNFYFHVSMAYALLRQAGVEIGKRDFLGEMPIQGG